MKVVMEGRALLKLLKDVAPVAGRGTFGSAKGMALLALDASAPILTAEAWDGVLGVRSWADLAYPKLLAELPPKGTEVDAPPNFLWSLGFEAKELPAKPPGPIKAEPGIVVAPVARLAGILAGFDDRLVQLSGLASGGVAVELLPLLGEDGKPEREQGGSWRIAGPSPTGWPSLPYAQAEDPVVIPPAVVARLGQAVDFVAKDLANMPIIGGVHLAVSQARAKAMATDGHVVASMDMADSRILPGKGAGMLPPRGVTIDPSGLKILAGLAGGGQDHVELHPQASGALVATWGPSMVAMPTRAGHYPDVEGQMPAALATEMTVNPKALRASLVRCQVLRDDTKAPTGVTLAVAGHVVSKASLNITMKGGESGDVDESLPGTYVGPADVAARPKLMCRAEDLLRLLDIVEGDAHLGVQTHDATGYTKGMALVRDLARPDFTGGVMPMYKSPHA